MERILSNDVKEHTINSFLGYPSNLALLKFVFNTFTTNSLERLKKEIQNNFKSKEKLDQISIINEIINNKLSSFHPNQFLLFCERNFTNFSLAHQNCFQKVYCNELELGDSFLKDLILYRFHTETLKNLIFYFFFSTWKYETFSNNFIDIVEKSLNPGENYEIIGQEIISIETSILKESIVFQFLCNKELFPFSSKTLFKSREYISIHMKKNQIPWDTFHNHSEKIFLEIFFWDYFPEFESFMSKTMNFELKSKLVYLFLKHNNFNDSSQINVESHVYNSMKDFFKIQDSHSMDKFESAKDIVQRFFFNQLKKELNLKTELTELDKDFILKLTRFEKVNLLKNSWKEIETSDEIYECEYSEEISDSSKNEEEMFEPLDSRQLYVSN
jgi:hypothetical protein